MVERLAGDVAGGGLAVDVLLGAAERVLVTVIGELGEIFMVGYSYRLILTKKRGGCNARPPEIGPLMEFP